VTLTASVSDQPADIDVAGEALVEEEKSSNTVTAPALITA